MKYFCKFLYGINQKLFVYFFYFSLSYIYCSKIAKKRYINNSELIFLFAFEIFLIYKYH